MEDEDCQVVLHTFSEPPSSPPPDCQFAVNNGDSDSSFSESKEWMDKTSSDYTMESESDNEVSSVVESEDEYQMNEDAGGVEQQDEEDDVIFLEEIININ